MKKRVGKKLLAGVTASWLALALVAPLGALAQDHGPRLDRPIGAPCSANVECTGGVCTSFGDGPLECTKACTSNRMCGEWGTECVIAEGETAGMCRPAGIGGRATEAFGSTEVVAMFFNFGGLLLILYFVGRKPLTEFLTRRRRSIEEGLEEARRLKAEAEKMYDEYSKRLEELDDEMDRIRDEMVRAGEVERDRIVQEAEAKAARMRREADFLISQQMKQLREDLTREAVEAAVATAQEVLLQKTTPSDQRRLAQRYLERLGETAREEERS